jgi:hypothetical protein
MTSKIIYDNKIFDKTIDFIKVMTSKNNSKYFIKVMTNKIIQVIIIRFFYKTINFIKIITTSIVINI